MYSSKTKMGWDIISTFKKGNNVYVVVRRNENNDFAWGSYYNEEEGTWGQGHYDYDNPKQAEEDMMEYALGVSIHPVGEIGLSEAFKEFALREAKMDKEYELTEADFDEFLADFHKEFEFEIEEAFDTYKKALKD